jgi:hypothetical protein
MRRLAAAGIDYMLSYMMSVVVYCIMISTWKMFRIIMGREFDKHSFILVVLLFFLSYIFTNVVYSIFFDRVFHGNTPGKRIAGYQMYETGNKDRKWVLRHAIARTVASILYVITAVYYIFTYKMPYDKICGINSK